MRDALIYYRSESFDLRGFNRIFGYTLLQKGKFLHRVVTMDEMWHHNFMLQIKKQSEQCTCKQFFKS